jgi:hypothetical protein
MEVGSQGRGLVALLAQVGVAVDLPWCDGPSFAARCGDRRTEIWRGAWNHGPFGQNMFGMGAAGQRGAAGRLRGSGMKPLVRAA